MGAAGGGNRREAGITRAYEKARKDNLTLQDIYN
jgi:hypothetical protein